MESVSPSTISTTEMGVTYCLQSRADMILSEVHTYILNTRRACSTERCTRHYSWTWLARLFKTIFEHVCMVRSSSDSRSWSSKKERRLATTAAQWKNTTVFGDVVNEYMCVLRVIRGTQTTNHDLPCSFDPSTRLVATLYNPPAAHLQHGQNLGPPWRGSTAPRPPGEGDWPCVVSWLTARGVKFRKRRGQEYGSKCRQVLRYEGERGFTGKQHSGGGRSSGRRDRRESGLLGLISCLRWNQNSPAVIFRYFFETEVKRYS